MSYSLWPHGLYSPWNSLCQNTGVGSLSLLQGIFPIQGLNPGLLPYRRILYQLSHKGSPRILEWVAYPFSSISYRSRNWTGVSRIAGGFFTNCTIREASGMVIPHLIAPFISWWISVLFPLLGYCEWCYEEHFVWVFVWTYVISFECTFRNESPWFWSALRTYYHLIQHMLPYLLFYYLPFSH